MIPRLLHQTFRSARPLSQQLEACLEANMRMNPDWEHRYYDDRATEEIIESILGPKFLDLYRRIDPHYGAVKGDIFRYACIYFFGGCYLDIKSVCTKPLTSVLFESDQCVLSNWDLNTYPGWGIHRELNGVHELQQWFILATPGNPLIEAALWSAKSNLERYSYLRDGFGQMAVLRITGPIAFTKAITPLLPNHSHRMANSAVDLGLTYEGFSTLEVRLAVTGKNYRDAVRPMIVPRSIPAPVLPFYLSSSDTVAALIRRVLRVYKNQR